MAIAAHASGCTDIIPTTLHSICDYRDNVIIKKCLFVVCKITKLILTKHQLDIYCNSDNNVTFGGNSVQF